MLFTKIFTKYPLALCSKCCISETATSICMRDTPLESLLNGQIGNKFISPRGAISTWWARPTAIAEYLVHFNSALLVNRELVVYSPCLNSKRGQSHSRQIVLGLIKIGLNGAVASKSSVLAMDVNFGIVLKPWPLPTTSWSIYTKWTKAANWKCIIADITCSI